LIVLVGGPGARTVAAYNPITGEGLWNSFEDKQGYVSPAYVTLAGQPQLLVLSGTRLAGLKVEDGGLLWEYPWKVDYDVTASQPLVLSSNRVFISSGYGTGCAAIEIAQTRSNLTARTVWKNKNLKNKFTSSVLWQGFIYGLDEDILVCLDTATGERKWKDGRYGYGQLLLASGHLIVLCGNGDLALVRATPDSHIELSRFPAIQGKTWNHPAVAEGRLLVRNSAEMACFDIAAP
jgi:outer membrane protein assembly factor BamB